MVLFKYLAFICLLSQAYSEELNEVETKFMASKIVPDVIDVAPTKLLQVTYGGTEVQEFPGCGRCMQDSYLEPLVTYGGTEVHLGNKVSYDSSLEVEPTFGWDAEPNTNYTLIMSDPDAVRGFSERIIALHLLVINIQGNDVSSGDYLASYLVPKPRFGRHRYAFLLFKQQGYLDLKESVLTESLKRDYFNVIKFAKENNLILDAGNFFLLEIIISQYRRQRHHPKVIVDVDIPTSFLDEI